MEDGFDERDDIKTDDVPVSLEEDWMETVKAWGFIGFKGKDGLLNFWVIHLSIQGDLDVV